MSTRLCPVCQTPLPSDAPLDLCPRCLMDMPLPPPGADGATPLIREGARVIGDYELRQEIGEGGMGTVYRAYQRSLKRVVALKTINPSRGSGNTDFLRRFRIEAEAIAALKHDNIVEIHEAGEHEGQSYFSMEFIEGGDLRQEIEAQGGRPIPLQRAVKLVAAIARAVHHAHERGVLHRDLKPANILLDSKDKPYVSDFGLARLFRDQFEASAAPPSGPQPALSVLTEVGQGMGSPGYTSSEQAEGRLDELTTASDVFSLGAILFHLITGQAPLPTKSWRNPEIWEEYVRLAKAGNFAKPSSLNRQIDADLESICLR